MTKLLAFFYTESPLHAGASDSLGVIDLPIQREAHTGYPVVWGQSLKGALRQAARHHPDWDDAAVTAVFGSEVSQAKTSPGPDVRRDAQPARPFYLNRVRWVIHDCAGPSRPQIPCPRPYTRAHRSRCFR